MKLKMKITSVKTEREHFYIMNHQRRAKEKARMKTISVSVANQKSNKNNLCFVAMDVCTRGVCACGCNQKNSMVSHLVRRCS